MWWLRGQAAAVALSFGRPRWRRKEGSRVSAAPRISMSGGPIFGACEPRRLPISSDLVQAPLVGGCRRLCGGRGGRALRPSSCWLLALQDSRPAAHSGRLWRRGVGGSGGGPLQCFEWCPPLGWWSVTTSLPLGRGWGTGRCLVLEAERRAMVAATPGSSSWARGKEGGMMRGKETWLLTAAASSTIPPARVRYLIWIAAQITVIATQIVGSGRSWLQGKKLGMSLQILSWSWSYFWMTSPPPCRRRFTLLICTGVLVLVACQFAKRWCCYIWSLVARLWYPVKLLHVLSLLSSLRSGVFTGDKWESLRCRSLDLAAKISLNWARWCFLQTYNSILNLRVVYQRDCRLSRWLYGWLDFKRPFEKTIVGFIVRILIGPLEGSSCVLRHWQWAFCSSSSTWCASSHLFHLCFSEFELYVLCCTYLLRLIYISLTVQKKIYDMQFHFH
jgi:hypothetical protein